MKFPNTPANLSEEDSWNKVEFDIQKKYFSHIVYCRLVNEGSFVAIPSRNNAEWVEHHLKNEYPNHDPAVHLGRYGSKKQIWNQIHPVSTLSKQILSERKDFGMINGITIPVQDRYSQNRGWFTLGGYLTDKEILEIYFDAEIDHYFRDIHINFSIQNIMKKTSFNFIDSKILVLSDYKSHFHEIAETAGTSIEYVKDLIANAYREKSINLMDIW